MTTTEAKQILNKYIEMTGYDNNSCEENLNEFGIAFIINMEHLKGELYQMKYNDSTNALNDLSTDSRVFLTEIEELLNEY